MWVLSFSACSSQRATRRRRALTQPKTCVAIFGQFGESQKYSEICSSRPSGPMIPDLTVTCGIPKAPYIVRYAFLRGSRNSASNSRATNHASSSRRDMPESAEHGHPSIYRPFSESSSEQHLRTQDDSSLGIALVRHRVFSYPSQKARTVLLSAVSTVRGSEWVRLSSSRSDSPIRYRGRY